MKKKFLIYSFLLFLLNVVSFQTLHCQESMELAAHPKPKSMYTFGYQIGGHTYVGVNHEYKITKLVGFHYGIGYKGYTTGFKLHFSDCLECPHLNISFKDDGFGELGTIGAEFASRLFTFKKNGKLATFAQFGYGYITNLSSTKHAELFGNESAREGIFTFSIGLSFW